MNKNTNTENGKMRLARFMSLSGVASRRKCEEIITSGRVTVNGQTVLTPACTVSQADTVCVDGKKVNPEKKIYIMLNKPRGYICSASDPHASGTVYDLISLPDIKHLFSAGRLDLDSEGLLIITNDGDYVEKLTHPKYGTVKQYRVKTNNPIPVEKLQEIRKGIRDVGEFLKPKAVQKVRRNEYLFVLTEGKKREIRRLVAYTGVKVARLKRISVGKLQLGNLPSGKWRYLTENDIRKSLQNP